MKVAIGYRIQSGPWGGGNRFAVSLAEHLRAVGHQVVFDLDDGDIDIILLTDPRWHSPSVSFAAGAITRYLLLRNPSALVVHRINECDERKGTHGMNEALVRANWCADFTVFVGSWMLDLPIWREHLRTPHSIILNGADARVFNPQGMQAWDGNGPLRLVTHHWGGNWMKGFDIYERLDAMMAEPEWRGRIEFTYIGNLPRGFRFRHAHYVAPLDGKALAEELRSHHAYVTASINEPGGNHQNEGALCGLPLLYRRSGCLPEYCDGFGVSFDEADFAESLQQLLDRYDALAAAMPGYPHTSERTCANYLTLLDMLITSREQLVVSRRLFRNPWLLLRNQIPF